jgi:spore coat polysaccharide biosynthesis protein SpsF (cytidylyltransferase family)
VDMVVLAIPTKDRDSFIGIFADRVCWHDDENDVLGRYYRAARQVHADIIVRVTGDCPLLSPELSGVVVAKLKETGADYASNVAPRSVPSGFDCEAFTMETLERAHRHAEPDEREHVTTWMRRSDVSREIVGNLSLDTAEDYKTICAAFGHEPHQCLQPA